MVVINIRRTTMVRPAEPTPRHRLWLSNLDLVVSRGDSACVYFYRPNGSSDFFDAARLREALTRALVPFYPMSGRLARDEKGRIEINCDGQGVLFVEAESDATVDDFGDFAPTMKLKPLIPIVDSTGDISSYPLVLVQVTYFKCGGVALGLAMKHMVGDGSSGLHFINSWSDVARGADIAVAPVTDRTILRARDPPTPCFPHVESQPPPSMKMNNSSMVTSHPVAKIFKFTREQLDLLKRYYSSGSATYSTYIVLAAHAWRCACISRELPADQMTQMYMAIDGRQRLCPPIGEGYFGNVIFAAASLATAGELMAGDDLHSRAAAKVHRALTRMDNEYLRSTLDYLELQPDLDLLARGPQLHQCPNFRFTSWAQLPIYDADFGWGRPVFMGPPCMSHEGLAYVLPSPSLDGSLSMAICLQHQHMLKFQNLVTEIFSSCSSKL